VSAAKIKRPDGATLLGLAGVLAVSALAAPYTVDDAFIVARYGQNLANGGGYAMNPGTPSDGVTGPLWIVPSYLAAQLGLPPIAASKLVGALCAALAAMVAVSWARGRALGSVASWAAASVLASLPDVGTWAVSGLETGAALLATTVLARALLGAREPAWLAAVAASTALAWLRPELAACAFVLWLARTLRAPRAALPWLAFAVLGALSIVAFRLAMFGAITPLSAIAKPADLAQGVSYVLRGAILMTSIAGAGLATYGAMRGREVDRWLLAALVAHGVAVALAGGDWMPGARLLVPVAGLYALLAGRGVARLWAIKRAPACIALAFALSVPLLDLAVRVPAQRASAIEREQAAAPLARRLRERGQTVALLDAGYLAYASGMTVVDLGGLTDPHIARLAGGHIAKAIDEAYLRARDPGVILLHTERPARVDDQNRLLSLHGYPVEHRIAAMPWVREGFRVAEQVRLHEGYGYVVLERVSTAKR